MKLTTPEGWTIIRSKDKLFQIIDGDRSTNYPNGKELLPDGDIPFLSTKNIINNKIDFSLEKRFITKAKLDSLSKGQVKKGDIVLTTRGSVGNAALFQNLPYKDAFINAQMVIFRTVSDKVDNRFLYYLTISPVIQNQFRYFMTGSAQSQLPVNLLNNVDWPFPSLPEQHKIADILLSWDTAIDLTEKLIQAKTQLKKGLMHQLLTGKKRFKGFSSMWKKIPFNQCAKFLKGYSYKSEDYSDNPDHTYFITLNCILKGGGFTKDGLKYLKNEPSDEFMVLKGDLVFANTDITRDGDVVGCPLLIPKLFNGKNVVISMDLTKVVCFDNLKTKFLYYYLQIPKVRKFMKSRSAGSTVLHLDVKAVKKMGIGIPTDIDEQEKMAGILSLLDDEINLLESSIKEIEEQKKGLMQKLLTGKIRVKV